MNDNDLFLKLKSFFNESLPNAERWRAQAKEDFSFYHGHQWSDSDASVLRSKNRPTIVINRIKPFVDAILGQERNNRRQVRFIPRRAGESLADDLLTSAADWFRDEAYAEQADSDAFSDLVIAGMGWTETNLSFLETPDGMPVVRHLNPFKMVWDHRAQKPSLSDANYLFYLDKKPLDELENLFPGVDKSEFAFNSNNVFFEKNEWLGDYSRNEGVVLEARFKEFEPFVRFISPETQAETEISKAEFYQQYQGVAEQIEYFEFKKQIVKRAFLGATQLLKPVDTPLAPPTKFGWEAMTGLFDTEKKLFYGFVRPLKDPQRLKNKFLSQMIHLSNTATKGGFFIERGAFEDDRQAMESLAKSDQITWVNSGAIAAGKIQPKGISQIPSEIFQLSNRADAEIQQTSGVSAEFLGLRDVAQAGILEAQRKQSSLTILAKYFDAVRLYRRRQGEVILYLLQNYLSDGRLIRILGQGNAQYVPLLRHESTTIEYDIIVDDSPTSPNEKERIFGIFMQLLPTIRDILNPSMLLEFLDYTELPASIVSKIKQDSEMAKQSQQNQQAQQAQQEQAEQLAKQVQQAQLEKTAAITKKLNADSNLAQSKADTHSLANQLKIKDIING